MRLVNRDHPDRISRQLDPAEAAAVRGFCGAGQEVRPGDVELVAAVLEEMHDGRHVRLWLECDCGHGAKTQPRLTARVRDEGPRHFVRMHRYGEHRCALASFRQTPEPEDGEPDADPASPGQHNPLKPVGDALDYLDDLHEGIARPGGSGGSTGGRADNGRRLPRLGRILHTLLDDAGFATAHVDSLKETTRSWDRLEAYAADEAMSPELTLGQVLYFKPWTSLNEKMATIDALPWPDKKARSALLLFVADEIHDGAAIKKTRMGECRVRPAKGIRGGGRDHGLTQPPYWALTVVDRDREGIARFREAFAQHAYSFARPVPLDSRYERRTLEQLFSVMEWVKKRGVDVTLAKPLFDREVRQLDDPSLWCRPDFEPTFRTVEAAGTAPRLHRVVIETMGADEPEYLERKSRMHEIMKRRGILIEHRVSDGDGQAERDDAFLRRVGAKILHLAGVQRVGTH
ncbi:hypothetical protein B0G76_8623 [Paraburkholderia sp. BL23I1N1]|uniref:hypothetical protein n=1 Tax=Paraburkholderia sp. BL23I1N1 TaxID=1938802 RepID=UPI000E716F83|nr:hypothetical protein [Paraburkholderia sp. BL23I1N1]RKE23923.1 hypothetical protein B0G76_8623 [Paraburkholderia sp. BL23I1N1]